jgi:uncharacterized protein YbcI
MVDSALRARISNERPGCLAQRRELHMSDISVGMVRLYKNLFGRSPTKAITRYAGNDLIVSTLENTLTRAEAI